MENPQFLGPLILLSGALTAFIGVRHQHISQLIRNKTGQLFLSKKDKPKLEPREIGNILIQIKQFRFRNVFLRIAVFFSSLGAMAFSSTSLLIYMCYIEKYVVCDIVSMFYGINTYIIFFSIGIFSLLISFIIAGIEFFQSQFTLDLEILLAQSRDNQVEKTMSSWRSKRLNKKIMRYTSPPVSPVWVETMD